jgi:hypothetical protein
VFTVLSAITMAPASNLSPAAQAVLDAAFTLADNLDRDVTEAEMIAAALRAAADQVVSAPRLPYDSCCDVNAAAIRAELLAIAIELETQ